MLVASHSGSRCLACCEKLRIVAPELWLEPTHHHPPETCLSPFQSHSPVSQRQRESHQPASPPVEKDCIRWGTQCGWDPIGQPPGGVGLAQRGHLLVWLANIVGPVPTMPHGRHSQRPAPCRILCSVPLYEHAVVWNAHSIKVEMYSAVSVKPRRTLDIWSAVCLCANTKLKRRFPVLTRRGCELQAPLLLTLRGHHARCVVWAGWAVG